MRGRHARWLTVGVAVALVAAGNPAAALPDTAPSPLLSTDAVGQIFPGLANVQPVSHTFTVPDTPECKSLAIATSALGQAAAVIGGEWDAIGEQLSLQEDVYQFAFPDSPKKFAHKAQPKAFLQCSRSTGAASDMLTISEINALEGPGHLLGDANAFFASGGVLNSGAGTTNFVTAWISYDNYVARLAVKLPGTDIFVKEGILTTGGRATLNSLLGAATNVLWQTTEGRPSSDADNAALNALDLNDNYTTKIDPSPPPADNRYCKELAKVESRRFPDQLTQYWRSEHGSFLQISRGFDTPKDARGYFNDLRDAGFVRCNASLYDLGSTPDLKFKFRKQPFEFPKQVVDKFGIRESSYLAIGGELDVTSKGSPVNRTWNLAGGFAQRSTVRLYFLSSDAPASWQDFDAFAATLIASDVAAEGAG